MTSPTTSASTGAPAAASTTRRQPPVAAVSVALAVLLAVVVGVLLIALGLPAAKSAPHHVPIGIAGPQQAATALQQGLSRRAGNAFDVTDYADEGGLRSAILDRKVYGGFVVGAGGAHILTASGGSPLIAQTLAALATPLQQLTGHPVSVTDLVPLPDSDPRGVGLAAAALPLTMAGLLPGILISQRLGRRPGVAAATALLAALAIGTIVALLLHAPFGAIQGSLVPVAAGLALGAGAISLTILGLSSVLGRVGLALGAAVIMLLGTPLSGLASAPEVLPSGWGAFGQFLPQGATATLLRSTSYFDGAGSGRPVLVLTVYVVAGLALAGLGMLRRSSTSSRAPAA